MRAQLMIGVRALLILTVLVGLLFPLAMTGISQVAFRDRANGSVLQRDGRAIGSGLLGQAFTGDRYFHPRPSAAGAAASGSMIDVLGDDGEPTGATEPADPNDRSQVASGASNLGPNSPDLTEAVEQRVAEYRMQNGIETHVSVPVDAVTESGSGLDPYISVANARLQADRVAAARGISVEEVLHMIDENMAGRVLAIFGEQGVNVLLLNLALDDRQAGR
jgi:K+-transporting ATPase ATPase C chain